MGYKVEECNGAPEQIGEVSAFLASFIADGEGASRDTGGRDPATWRSRFAWWWDENPYCRKDSPRGFILRKESGEVAGFSGFIPHDYILGGQIVPSLISTTTFVRNDSREAALGLVLRAHRLRESYHLVDGGPNKEMQALLEKTGYRHADKAKVFLFPVNRWSLRPKSWLLQTARAVPPHRGSELGPGRLVTHLDEVDQIPDIRDPRLRKHADRQTLAWYLASGSLPKHFVGWCDEDGVLQCYLLGFLRRRFGLTVFVIIEAASFDPRSENLVGALVAHTSRNPRTSGIPDGTDIVAWPTGNHTGHRASPFAVGYDSKLFYRLPARWGDAERLCFPLEGDKALL